MGTDSTKSEVRYSAKIEDVPMSEADERELGDSPGVPTVDEGIEAARATSETIESLPDWAKEALPVDLKLPQGGKQIAILRLESGLTDAQAMGDRTIVIWNLTVRDERLARTRARGHADWLYDEYAKRMLRAIDGKAVLDTASAVVDRFWDEIGSKYRGHLVSWYVRTHNLSDEERLRFFTNNVVIRTAT